jgi:hypothetical protein
MPRLEKKQCNRQSTHGCTEREKRRKPAMSSQFCRGAELGSLPLIAKVMTLAGTISASRSEPVAEFDEGVAIRRAVRDAAECLIATNAG